MQNVKMEMSIYSEADLKSLALPKETKVVYNGLENQGATSYLNSALQVLFMTKEFREAVERLQITPNDDEVLYHLQQLFENLKAFEQQDAVESVVSPDASQVYEATLVKTLRCLKKDHGESHEGSTFLSLPISINAGLVFSVVDGLEAFFQTTRIHEDARLYCDDCDEKTDMEISFNIQKYPTILTLHLKRFYFDDMKMGYQKNCRPMDIPSTLTFESCTYDLYGVIKHSGAYRSGHYYAYIQSPENNDWFCFDDSHVVKITDKDFLKRSRNACMILYRKRESSPSSPHQEEDTMETSTEEALETARADEIPKEIKNDTATKNQVCQVGYNGLEIQGATCYLNSALQVLFMTKEFREAVERLQITPNDNEVLHQLQQLFKNLKADYKCVSTVKITESLSIKKVFEQQDAVEWFEKILSVVSPDASQVYEGTLRKTLKCLKKDHRESHEDSIFFSLPISIDAGLNEVFRVVDGLEVFFQTTSFDEDNWLYCDDCDEKTNMEIRFNIQKYPTILTLHLKRFYFDYMKMGYQKNCCPMDIPSTLTFESCTYDLYGVINHSGVYGSGHYYSYIQSPENNDWYCFDDSHVVKITDKDFLKRSRNAYMILYRKRESSPSSPHQEENTMETSTEEALETARADEIPKEIQNNTATENRKRHSDRKEVGHTLIHSSASKPKKTKRK